MKFSINIDHVAFLRNARGENRPDPVTYALMAEEFGVDGIVVHLREDRRHIKDKDLQILREVIKTKLDLEMAATDEIIGIACKTKPELVTLVPEKREELTTEGGLDVKGQKIRLREAIKILDGSGIPVSLFIEPEKDIIDLSKEIGAQFIEIHTGVFANAKNESDYHNELSRICSAAEYAKSLGLSVNAGHGLNYHNTRDIASINTIDEVSIGQAVIAHSVFVGIEKAIKEMISLIRG